MKLLLNQYFPFTPADITESVQSPDAVKGTNAEYLLFLRTDDQTRSETNAFLKHHFENDLLDDMRWRLHLSDLKAKSVQQAPSFVIIQLTDPVRILLYGFCQAMHCYEQAVLEVFKPKTQHAISIFDRSAMIGGSWVLGYSDHSLREPLETTTLRALTQRQISFELFFFEHFVEEQEAERHFNLLLVQVQEVVDLAIPCGLEPIRQQLRQISLQARPTTKTLIANCLREKTVGKDPWWSFAKSEKTDYEALAKALRADLELKRIEIVVLQQQTNFARIATLETALEQKVLEINGLQTQIRALNDKLSDLALVRKGAEAMQKELDALKKAFDQLSLEKTQLIQQLKEAQSAHNQWVTRYESLSKQFAETKLQLDNLQKEKQVLQKKYEDTAKGYLHQSNDLERLQKEKEQLQQLQNQSVTRSESLSNQLKVVQAEKEYLQKVQNQSVAQNAKQLQDAQAHLSKLKTENADLQKVQNQAVTRYESLINQLKTENADLQRIQNQSITQNETLFKIGQDEILRLQKLLELKAVAEKQPIPIPTVIPSPVVPKPIIITKPTIKAKLPFEPELILVEGGTFKMGRDVTLSSYAIGKYPITQAQWQAVMGANPSRFKGDHLPVECVNWNDAQDFISKLNEKTGKTYSLPTEAQWEFAARGGTKSKGFEYSGSNNLDEVGWFWENSGDKKLSGDWDYDKMSANNCKTHPVGEKKENELDIHDMSGNVWEWCSDWYGNYSSAAVTNPIGAVGGTARVLRGGSWCDLSMRWRVADRRYSSPSDRIDAYGFRVVSFP